MDFIELKFLILAQIGIDIAVIIVFIYLISLINLLNLDLSKAFVKKMEKNKIKYNTNEFNNGLYYKK